MTSPTFLRHTSPAEAQFAVGRCARITSRIRLSVGFTTLSFLTFFWLLVGSLLFTNARAQPDDQITGSTNSEWMSNLGFHGPDQQFAPFGLSGTPQIAACRGRCLDPHPGAFKYWNGQQNGCWVQVWRSWPEGCQHYQWYNACNGYWDNHPNGAARVYWSCCVH